MASESRVSGLLVSLGIRVSCLRLPQAAAKKKNEKDQVVSKKLCDAVVTKCEGVSLTLAATLADQKRHVVREGHDQGGEGTATCRDCVQASHGDFPGHGCF